MTWCMTLSLIAAVGLTAAVADLRSARRGLAQSRAEAHLDSAQVLAAAMVLSDPGAGRWAWVQSVDGLKVSVLAEPEADKLAWAMVNRDAPAFRALAPAAPQQAAAALARLATTPESPAGKVSGLDPSARWRACAASVLSPHGAGDGLLAAPRAPKAGRGGGRIGQVWRIRTALPQGWTETRYLRFTGEAGQPWAILERSLVANPEGNLPCLP